MSDDVIEHPGPPASTLSPEEHRFRVMRSALAELVKEVRAATAVRNNLGLKANVALNVADRALKTYPAPID